MKQSLVISLPAVVAATLVIPTESPVSSITTATHVLGGPAAPLITPSSLLNEVQDLGKRADSQTITVSASTNGGDSTITSTVKATMTTTIVRSDGAGLPPLPLGMEILIGMLTCAAGWLL